MGKCWRCSTWYAQVEEEDDKQDTKDTEKEMKEEYDIATDPNVLLKVRGQLLPWLPTKTLTLVQDAGSLVICILNRESGSWYIMY